MSRRLVGGVAFVAVVMMCVAANAQPGGQRGGGPRGAGVGLTQLLMNEAVREDLGVKEDQVAKLREVAQSMREDAPAFDREAFQNMSEEERREQMEKITAAREKMEAKMKEKLGEILNKDQVARLEQIQLQVAGFGMFRNPKVVEALNLTEEQQGEMRTAAREAMSGGRPEPGQMAELQKKMMDNAMKVLNDDQKATIKKMIGKPFDVSKIQARGGGRPGGGQRGGKRDG